MVVEMRIQGLMFDPITKSPVVLLRDPQSDAKLPLWVGIFEANAIATELERVRPPRPMTHDLLMDVLKRLGAKLTRVLIHDLQDNVFFAQLQLETAQGPVELDSRPSDAIALALRFSAPIFANESVIQAAQTIDLMAGHEDAERLRGWLEGLDDGDLGKYQM